jgi:hypothetical protein
MEQSVRTALSEGRIEDEKLLSGVRLEKVVSPASTKQAMIARVSLKSLPFFLLKSSYMFFTLISPLLSLLYTSTDQCILDSLHLKIR